MTLSFWCMTEALCCILRMTMLWQVLLRLTVQPISSYMSDSEWMLSVLFSVISKAMIFPIGCCKHLVSLCVVLFQACIQMIAAFTHLSFWWHIVYNGKGMLLHKQQLGRWLLQPHYATTSNKLISTLNIITISSHKRNFSRQAYMNFWNWHIACDPGEILHTLTDF